MERDPLKEFRIWLVMYDIDMLMNQHQISWAEVEEGTRKLEELRAYHKLAPIPQPEFDPRLIKGHTHVAKQDNACEDA